MLNLSPRDRQGQPSRPQQRGVTRSVKRGDDEQVPTIVGFAHLGLGAVGLTAAGVGLLFNAQTPVLLAVLIVRVVFELATCYAGLLIKDGLKKGAVIALVTGAVRIALLLVSADVGLMLLVSVVLVGASGWLLPTLARPEPKQTGA